MKIESLASRLHRWTYGKSDSANAVENQSAEFQAGYKAAMESDSDDLIYDEWQRRGSPTFQTEDFREWKRGMWAFRLQQAEAKGLTAD